MPDTGDLSFRDHIGTTDAEGLRSWVYASKPKGKLHSYRVLVSVFLLTIFFTMPFIKVNGNPFLLLNIFDRHFVVFGNVFWPQDFHLFVIAIITLVITIVLFTVIYGRVWCGWACPQTIFMEMVYRKIEFWIEGSAARQRKMDSATMSFEKFWKKALKHILFIAIASLVMHFFAAYLVGINRLGIIISEGAVQHSGAFIGISILTLLFYFIFARFREQVCTLVCPYGRLQGALLDANSLVVHYDYKRGENRGKWDRSENRTAQGKGDCIDCRHCLQVCPTGIDIRNGTQLECINCTACIDSCNHVMKQLGYKPGLIRIASYTEIAEDKKFRFTPRVIAYTALLVILISIVTTLFITRNDTETTILRVPGSLYQEAGEELSNIYNLKLINKSGIDMQPEIRLLNHQGRIQYIGQPMQAASQGIAEGVFLLYLPKEAVTESKTELTFGVFIDDKLIEKEKATFVGPN